MSANEITERGELVRKYLEEFWGKLSIRAIASRIFNTEEGQRLFKEYETVRSLVRYHVGSNGEKSRDKIGDRVFFTDNLPTSRATKINHYNIPKAQRRVLNLADIHAPFHDSEALAVAIRAGLDFDADTINLNGDIVDFYSKSRFETDYRKRNLVDELYTTRDILYSIRETFPNALIIFKNGNHEDRWRDFLNRNELSDFKEMSLASILHFNDLGIVEVESRATIWAGKLAVLHGHEHKYGMIAPVNPARGLFLRTKQSAFMNHVHRVSEHTEKSHDGKLIGCWSGGCLCQLDPEYAPYNNYGHGFAQFLLEPDGNFTVLNKKIIDGKVY